MSHIYQQVMFKTILQGDCGDCSISSPRALQDPLPHAGSVLPLPRIGQTTSIPPRENGCRSRN
jgi:hypothetical protein